MHVIYNYVYIYVCVICMCIYIYAIPPKIYLFACWMKQTWWMKRTCMDLQTLSSLKKTMQMPLLKVAEEDCNGQAKPRGTFSPRPEQIGAPKQRCLACRKTEAARCMPTNLHCDASTHTAQIGYEHGGGSYPPWTIFDEPPGSMNDLCACFDSNRFPTWKFVGFELGKIRQFPNPFALHFGRVLLVYDTVV